MSRDLALQIRNLRVRFHGPAGAVEGVGGVDLDLPRGGTLAVIGESGSGKSATAKAIMGLFDQDTDKTVSGEICIDGHDVAKMTPRARRRLHGPTIGMVSQDALSALNPVYPVGDQIAEMFRSHTGAGRSDAKSRAIQVMDQVRIPSAERRYGAYPHEFSGGMRQRVLIAIAVALGPRILIADEPTTALDVTVQAHVMKLLVELQHEMAMSTVLITHDLGVAASFASQVVVMYAGRVVETATMRDILTAPRHPYTMALVAAIPRLGGRRERMVSIPGNPPDLAHLHGACPFEPRCAYAVETCRIEDPPLRTLATGRVVACHRAEEIA